MVLYPLSPLHSPHYIVADSLWVASGQMLKGSREVSEQMSAQKGGLLLQIEGLSRHNAPEPELYLYLTSVLPTGVYQSPSFSLVRPAAPPPLLYTCTSLLGLADEGHYHLLAQTHLLCQIVWCTKDAPYRRCSIFGGLRSQLPQKILPRLAQLIGRFCRYRVSDVPDPECSWSD